MKPVISLPEHYEEIDRINLENNKKQMLQVNSLSIAIMLTMAIGMHFFVPITTIFEHIPPISWLIRLLTTAAALVLYILSHEITHGLMMKLCGCHQVKYGFTGIYAYASCHDFIPKKQYLIIAMAPVLIWGVLLATACMLVPVSWFWVVYIIQITNISGAAGDLYVTFRFFPYPDDILIHDSGAAMTVYAPNGEV